MSTIAKKISFHTLGCKLNFSETSTLSRDSLKYGYENVDSKEFADIYVFNTCSVTENADKELRVLVKKALKKNPMMNCVVGLSTEPERLADIRKNRMNSLKEKENINYTDLENIKKEVLEAKKTFQKYKWPLIAVTRKSCEETAASIIKIHEIYLNNVK